MEELKKFENKHEIHIKLCLTLSKHGFKFLGTNDLGEVSGFCDECGHNIRYEQNFVDVQTRNEYTIGSDCMFKIYILSHWKNQIKEKDLENKDLQRAGKWLWIINRDKYMGRIGGELPQPKNYDENFKKLADDLKILIFKVRAIIKKEIAEENRKREELRKQELMVERNNKEEQYFQGWITSQGININKCNDWEKDFLTTMYKAEIKGWVLSEKQLNIFNKIKNEKLEEQVVESVFIGKIVNAWLINEKTGNWTSGIVKSVEKETERAILCDVLIDGDSEEMLKEVWIPKSQLSEDIIL